MKRYLSILLCLALLISLIPPAAAEQGIQINEESSEIIFQPENEEMAYEEEPNWEELISDIGSAQFVIPNLEPGIVSGSEPLEESVNITPMMTVMNSYTPDPSILNAVANLNVKTPQAPYSITMQQESISTLNGNLSVEATDLALPGRNGLSFELKRVYDASNAEFFEKGYELYLFCVCRLEYSGVQYQEWENPSTGHNYRTITHAGRFYYDPSISNFMNNVFDTYGLSNYIHSMAGKGEAFSSSWSSVQSNGYRSRMTAEISSNPNVVITDSYTGNTLIWWRDKAKEKTYEEQLYPIGKGWMWNVPYIKSVEGRRYLNLLDQGSYEISGSTLKGYPFQDLTIVSDSSVTVNGKRSSTALKSIHGTHYYFAGDGRLIQIADRYDNTVTFHYSQHATYGTVLTSIVDALGNAIEITYNTNEVVLTQGDKTVKYSKYTYYSYDPLPPFSQLQTEMLLSVTDAAGRRTLYDYSMKDAMFSIVGTNPAKSNMTALLSEIYHPTGAVTSYTYTGAVTRRVAASAVQNAYRISSRKDTAAGVTYNLQNYTYTNPQGANTDYASSYGQSISNFYVNVDNGLTRTVFDQRKKVANTNDSPEFYTNRVTQTAGNEQRITSYQYDEARKITTPIQTTTQYRKGTTAATAIQTSRTFDNYGNVLTETDALGNVTTYTYHSTSKLLSSVTNRIRTNESRYTEFSRNAQGSITQVQVRENDANGRLMAQVAYEDLDSHGNVRRTVVKDDARDIVYETEYGTAFLGGYPTKQTVTTTDADGLTQEVEHAFDYYLQSGLVKSYTNGNGHTTHLQYDKADRITKLTHPDASTVTATYNNSANQMIITDETGIVTRKKWDRLGNPIEEAILDGGVYRILATYGYDAYGRLTWGRDNANKVTNYEYDAWSRPIRTIYPDQSFTEVTYDDINRRVTNIDPEGNQVRSTSDVLGKTVLTEEWREGQFRQLESLTYDFEGNVRTYTNATDTTAYSYDVLGRVKSVTDALQNEHGYTYSMGGNLTGIIYPDGNQVLKQYDELGRLIGQTNELGQLDKYYYDANGNLIRHIDRKGQLLTYTYNNRDFMTGKQAPDDTVSFTYDKAGRRKTMSDATGTTSYEHKAATGELLRVVYPDNRNIRYTYNSLGLRATMTDPFGAISHYTYDNRDRLTGVGSSTANLDATYSYYNNNLLQEINLSNGNRSSFAYEGMRLSELTHRKSDGTLLHTFRYGYDGNGNIIEQSGTQDGAAFHNEYNYDALNRIAESSQFNESYSYDNRGNRASMHTENPLQFFELSNKQYEYDAHNRLIKATVDGTEVTYRYNGDGLLYERSESGTTTRYYYDGGNVIAEGIVGSGGATSLKARYVRGRGLAAREDGNGKAYYLHNGHGDVIELRDSTGNLSLNSYTYDMWGNPLTEAESVANPFRYSGELWDATTQLQYLRARWYDPSVGRFISKDTYEGDIANPLTLNLYTYVHNNPLIYIDPTGHLVYAIVGSEKYSEAFNKEFNETVPLCYGICGIITKYYTDIDAFTLEMSMSVYNNIVMTNDEKKEYFNSLSEKEKSKYLVEMALIGIGTIKAPKAQVIIPWSSKSVQSAATQLGKGVREVTVGSRSEAEELFLRLYQGNGYRNTTGMSATEAKKLYGGKEMTYHWDDVVDSSGRVSGHGVGNPHGNLPHLQIHDENGRISRIFYK